MIGECNIVPLAVDLFFDLKHFRSILVPNFSETVRWFTYMLWAPHIQSGKIATLHLRSYENLKDMLKTWFQTKESVFRSAVRELVGQGAKLKFI